MRHWIPLALSVAAFALGAIAHRRLRQDFTEHLVTSASVTDERIQRLVDRAYVLTGKVHELDRFSDVMSSGFISVTQDNDARIDQLEHALCQTIEQQDQQDRELRQLAANVGGVGLLRSRPRKTTDRTVWIAPGPDTPQ